MTREQTLDALTRTIHARLGDAATEWPATPQERAVADIVAQDIAAVALRFVPSASALFSHTDTRALEGAAEFINGAGLALPVRVRADPGMMVVEFVADVSSEAPSKDE